MLPAWNTLRTRLFQFRGFTLQVVRTDSTRSNIKTRDAFQKRFSSYSLIPPNRVPLISNKTGADKKSQCNKEPTSRKAEPSFNHQTIRRYISVTVFFQINQKSRPTIGGAGDTTIPFPGWSPKQPLPRIGLHDLLYGRQACPEFNSFHQGWSNISRGGAIFVPSPFKTGTNLRHPRPPQSLNDSKVTFSFKA